MIYNTVLNRNDFVYFKDIITRESGIQIPETKFSLVQARLMRRMRDLNIGTYSDYRNFLDENYLDEIENFVNSITTNKTEFFRENHHFEFMKDRVFPEYMASRKKKIRIWSAGCSTGEEPYSIAMTCNSFYDESDQNDIKILATDIDTNVLEKAYSGIYSYDNISYVDDRIIMKYFSRVDDENFCVTDKLKKTDKIQKAESAERQLPDAWTV